MDWRTREIKLMKIPKWYRTSTDSGESGLEDKRAQTDEDS